LHESKTSADNARNCSKIKVSAGWTSLGDASCAAADVCVSVSAIQDTPPFSDIDLQPLSRDFMGRRGLGLAESPDELQSVAIVSKRSKEICMTLS